MPITVNIVPNNILKIFPNVLTSLDKKKYITNKKSCQGLLLPVTCYLREYFSILLNVGFKSFLTMIMSINP